MEKYNKILSKIYNHLVQQKVHNNSVTLLIKRFVFTKFVQSLSIIASSPAFCRMVTHF